MKPISLHGHDRSITQIRYNREGDLLFSCAKDSQPNVWYSVNGERLGSFDGHQGALWCLDVDWSSEDFISGSADNTIRLWDVETGKMKRKIDTNTSVRACGFSYSGDMVAFSTDAIMKMPCQISIVDRRTFSSENPIMQTTIPSNGPRVTAMVWWLDDMLITGHDNGDIVQWDIKTKQKLKIATKHQKAITDIQLSSDGTMFISSSKDNTAKLFDVQSLECLKNFQTERPVNSASLSPKMEHVVLGGGQEAMDVTTTSSRVGKFDARFFHVIFEEEFARVKGHFGPINSVQYHPDGLSFASGGEDGYVRLHNFDKAYLDFNFEN